LPGGGGKEENVTDEREAESVKRYCLDKRGRRGRETAVIQIWGNTQTVKNFNSN